ncbi:MAG: recombinase family protein [Candidatus Omnitrophica bacterium]|nr:recombinase family protein [Candidatus Omnitrophota bacterium]
MDKQKPNVIIYARCSTDENKQDVEVQLKELRRYCEAYGWSYEEAWEYGSGYKTDCQPKLDGVLEKIRLKQINVLLVFSMDRFSRQSPSKINALLDTIVERYGCRFISLQQGIDSDNELTWHVVKPLFTYFANKFSKDLGEKVKKGIAMKKVNGTYKGGRPAKKVDLVTVQTLRSKGISLRSIAEDLNQGKSGRQRTSYASIQRLLQKHR